VNSVTWENVNRKIAGVKMTVGGHGGKHVEMSGEESVFILSLT
jgi:hypothetical protein